MAAKASKAHIGKSPLTDATDEGKKKVWRWGIVIAIGGFLFGFDTGVISGALLFFKDDFDLSSFQQGSVVSVLLIGAMFGALGAGPLGSKIGRKKTLGLEGVVFLIGTIIAVAANGYEVLLIARLILGLAVGAASATVPVYLSEISPPDIRGRILTLNQLLITVGILSAYLVNLSFSGAEDWRAMFAVGAIPAIALALGSLWVPESPSWQIAQGHVDRARSMIASVAGDHRADELVDEFSNQTSAEAEEGEESSWKALAARHARPALIVGLGLAAIQQFGGINTIIYYAPTIMEDTGLSASNAVLYSVAIGIINLAMTVVSIRLVDRIGRRKLLLISLGGMFVTLTLLGLTFIADLASGLSLAMMVLYIVAFAIGLGPVFWVLIGEIFPSDVRSVGSAAATSVNWASNFLVSLVFLTVVNAIGQGETFWIFAVICAIGFWFVGRYVPETKNREPDEIETDLGQRFGRKSEELPGETSA